MNLRELRGDAYTLTINNQKMKLRCTLNALDYLERVCGGIDKAFNDPAAQKHFIRAFLLCNYDNEKAFDSGRMEDLQPSPYQIGDWFDAENVAALSSELYHVAMEQMRTEDRHEPGETAPEVVAALIGALSKLYGQEILTEALRIFGTQPPEKSQPESNGTRK